MLQMPKHHLLWPKIKLAMVCVLSACVERFASSSEKMHQDATMSAAAMIADKKLNGPFLKAVQLKVLLASQMHTT